MRVNTARVRVAQEAYEARRHGSSVTHYVGTGDVICSRPVELHMFGYPDKLLVHHGIEPDTNLSQRMFVRCRKCPECLKHRARLWTARAMDETKVSVRTWFGTLTVSPERQTWARYKALSELKRRESDVTEEAVFRKSAQILLEEVTRFLKRVRKIAPLRFMQVTEAHKSGLPHFHLLIHEYNGSISKRVLEDRWRYGFSHWRLVPMGDEKACGYCCKYLSKSALTRVRASKGYGETSLRLVTDRLETLTKSIDEVRRGSACSKGEGTPNGDGHPI